MMPEWSLVRLRPEGLLSADGEGTPVRYPLSARTDEGDSVVGISGGPHENWCDFFDLPQGSDAAWDTEMSNRIARFDAGESQTVAVSGIFAVCVRLRRGQSGMERQV